MLTTNFHNLLRQWMAHHGLTDMQAAERFGVQRNSVWHWRNGRLPRRDLLIKCMQIMQSELPSMVMREDQPTKPENEEIEALKRQLQQKDLQLAKLQAEIAKLKTALRAFLK